MSTTTKCEEIAMYIWQTMGQAEFDEDQYHRDQLLRMVLGPAYKDFIKFQTEPIWDAAKCKWVPSATWSMGKKP